VYDLPFEDKTLLAVKQKKNKTLSAILLHFIWMFHFGFPVCASFVVIA
jgi:hypothetical protein